MDQLIAKLSKLDIVRGDLDYHLIRATMVILFFFFGCQKWFDYEAHALVPFISHGPLIFWLYPVFGIRGAAYFLGSAEWLFGFVMFLGFWNKKLGVLRIGIMRHLRGNGHDHPVFPRALGSPRRRLSGRNPALPVSGEGYRAARRFGLSAQAGHSACKQHRAPACDGGCPRRSDVLKHTQVSLAAQPRAPWRAMS